VLEQDVGTRPEAQAAAGRLVDERRLAPRTASPQGSALRSDLAPPGGKGGHGTAASFPAIISSGGFSLNRPASPHDQSWPACRLACATRPPLRLHLG
jgi:hypothetical protein